MTTPVLEIQGVSKRYTSYRSTFHRMLRWFGADVQPKETYQALDGIVLSVAPGESVALIGQNGAGKSTLLKVVTGTIQPSEGRVSVAGRISAVLELGLGFNPDISGRANVYHAGGLMGYSVAELDELMPHIEAFAEIEQFFDQPLRVYSSGMQARLAFALATARRPEILVVDEVLSVGDSYFAHKSFARIREFRDKGTSIFLVSHSMADVKEICDRVILMDKGKILKDGLPDEVVDYYNAIISEREDKRLTIEQRRSKEGWLNTRSGSFDVTLSSVELLDKQSEDNVATARVGQSLTIRAVAQTQTPIPELVLGLHLTDRAGRIIWGTNTWHTQQPQNDLGADETLEFRYSFDCTLGPGSYGLSVTLHDAQTHVGNNYEWQENVLVFDVVNLEHPVFIGSNWLNGSFSIERHE